MKHIFYFIGVIFVIKEMMWLINPKREIEKTKKLINYKSKAWSECDDNEKSLFISILFRLLIFSWLFIGLFTFNWVAFLAVLVFNFIIIGLAELPFKDYEKGYMIIHWLNSVVGFCFGIFVIINSYHLKIDLWELILNFFK